MLRIIYRLPVLFLLLVNTVVIAQPKEQQNDEEKYSRKLWYEDWDAGMEAAIKDNKPILVDFYSDGCGACKAMHNKTFTEPGIIKLFKDYWICIRINTSHTDKYGTIDGKKMSYSDLARYYRVRGVPTYVFFDKERKPVQSVLGYKNSELFGFILNYIKEEVYKKGISFKEYRESKTNL